MREKKHPDKFCINIRGKLHERLLQCMQQTGLRPTDIIRNAMDDYLSKRNL